MKIRLLSSALNDLYDGRFFYEKQGEGLGEYFYDSLFSDIDSLTLHGGIHPKFFGCHRMLSKRFPYAIRRRRRSGHLFQNRYKSILCQEEPYLLELVRYIHLNPCRTSRLRGKTHENRGVPFNIRYYENTIY
jgi:hypothetical protein